MMEISIKLKDSDGNEIEINEVLSDNSIISHDFSEIEGVGREYSNRYAKRGLTGNIGKESSRLCKKHWTKRKKSSYIKLPLA